MFNIKAILGQNVKKLRLSKDLSQEKFAELVNLDTKMISKIENGTTFISADSLANLCEGCEITPDLLFKVLGIGGSNLRRVNFIAVQMFIHESFCSLGIAA